MGWLFVRIHDDPQYSVGKLRHAAQSMLELRVKWVGLNDLGACQDPFEPYLFDTTPEKRIPGMSGESIVQAQFLNASLPFSTGFNPFAESSRAPARCASDRLRP